MSNYDDYSPRPEQQRQELLGRFLLELQSDLEELRQNWFGLRVNPNYLKALPNSEVLDMRALIFDQANSIVNEKGANALYSELSGELNKIVSVSNVDEDVIIAEVKNFHWNFMILIARMSHEWDFKADHYSSFVNKAVRLVKAAWFASKGGIRMKLTLQPGVQREVIATKESVGLKPQRRMSWLGGSEN